MKLKLMNIFNVITNHDEIIDDLNSLPEDINLNRIKTLAMNKVNAQDKAKNMKKRTIKTIGISTALALILGLSTISIVNSNTLVEFFGEKINMVSPYIESSTELTKFKDLSITLDGYMVSGNTLTTIFTIEKNSCATFK